MKNTSSGWFFLLALLSLLVCHAAAVAQQPVYGIGPTNNFQSQSNNFASPPVGATMPGSGQFGAPYMGTSALASSAAARSPYSPMEPGMVALGPVNAYPHLLYRLIYGNGIEALPGINSTTFVNTLAPGVLLTIGNHWTLDYTPSLSFYSNPAFRDTTGQQVILKGGTTYNDWKLGLSQSYVNSTDPLVETGTQVAEEAYSTAFNAAWQMSGKTSLQLGVNQSFRFTTGFTDLHEWTTSDGINYQLEPQLGVLVGVVAGYDELSFGSDMPFEQAQVTLNYKPGPRLNLTVMGGGEDRQFIKPSAPPLVDPIFSATAQYLVREGTTVGVSGSRVVTPSFYGNEINVITSLTGNVRQHIVGKVYLLVGGGYTSEPFTSIEPGPLPKYFFGVPSQSALSVTRSDTRTYAQVRLSTTFRTRLTGSIFYMYSDNSSSQANFNYSGNQVGLELSYRY